jgi:hypothetical protein
LKNTKLDSSISKSVGILFDQVALMTSAGFYLAGDEMGARKIALLAKDIERYKTMVLIRLVMVLPLNLLMFAKLLRHKKISIL